MSSSGCVCHRCVLFRLFLDRDPLLAWLLLPVQLLLLPWQLLLLLLPPLLLLLLMPLSQPLLSVQLLLRLPLHTSSVAVAVTDATITATAAVTANTIR